MLSTIVVIALLLAVLLASCLLWALLLRVGLRWAKVQDVTARRLALATVLVILLQMACTMVTLPLSSAVPALQLVVGIAELALAVLIPCFIIKQVFNASFVRALQAWLPTLISPVVMIALVVLVFRPFLVEAFVSPSNAMAPTLLGNHWQGACVQCGNPAFCTPIPAHYSYGRTPSMICRDNFHVTQPTDIDDQAFSPDRFLVVKFFKPRRWDVTVFRYPEDPSVLYVMRLVGLPGEEITIHDGQVFADGEVLTPPDSIRVITYESEMPDGYGQMWGTVDRPAKLADDEYFVLGDFSPQSKDSRHWVRGAPGHSPFAVPESHLVGVVTHTYWPLRRWQVFR